MIEIEKKETTDSSRRTFLKLAGAGIALSSAAVLVGLGLEIWLNRR